jgi:Cu+-exporting ATPase
MDRRNFLCKVTVAGAAIPAAAAAADAKTAQTTHATNTVAWNVKGFTCITCAVGLEVMLRGLPGVAGAKATYPESKVTIQYDAHMLTEPKLREFIEVCGFKVA